MDKLYFSCLLGYELLLFVRIVGDVVNGFVGKYFL